MFFIKRTLSLLLAMLMLFVCLPESASATAFSELLEVASDGDTLTLQENVTEDVTVDKNICIDLNGYAITGMITVCDGYSLHVMDSQTDDYTVRDGDGYGTVAVYTGNLLPQTGYMMVEESNKTSFHRVDMDITSMTLRPECAGVYYNGMFYADELAAANISQFGIALRIKQAPDADYMKYTSAYSWYDGFLGGPEGNVATGTLLQNVMSLDNTTVVNDSQSKLKIWGCTYIKTTDGAYVFGDIVSRSLMEQVQAADGMWKTLTAAQKSAIKTMYKKYAAVMENWYLPNMNNTDIDVPI